MYKNIPLLGFMRQIFDDDRTARKAAEIGEAMLAARPLCLRRLRRK